MVNSQLGSLKLALLMIRYNASLPLRRFIVPEDKNRRITCVCNQKIVFLNQNNSSGASTQMNQILLTLSAELHFLHLII